MAADVRYTKEHEWILVDGNTVAIGVTEYAQNALGDLVYVELPAVGDRFEKGDDFAVIESVKTAAEVYTPVAGEVYEVNGELQDNADKIKSGLSGGWIAKLKVSDIAALDELMDQAAYQEYVSGLE